MTKQLKRVAVTGGAGQIAYNLLFRIASGEMLGPDQPIALHILEVPSQVNPLSGVVMELQDCAFPLLQEIQFGSDPHQLFKDANIALLVGSKPRSPGMERKDLLLDNGKIFVDQGKALNEVAADDVRVLVVGNPCNTNCLIAMNHARRIPRGQFHAMTRLDQNRAAAQLAIKAEAPVSKVTHMTIWGNHSSTQVPDYVNAKINAKEAQAVIQDLSWLQGEFVTKVQKRGAAIMEARGKSSAASAASAAIDAIKDLVTPTMPGRWYSSGVCSDVNPYGVEGGLVFSFPCRTKENGECEIVPDLQWDDFLKAKMSATTQELREERTCVLPMATTRLI